MNFQRLFSPDTGKSLKAVAVFCSILCLISTVRATDPSTRLDFDGDGKTDLAVFRPGQRGVFPFQLSYFYILSSRTGELISKQWGRAYDIQTPADYDGDGKTDVGIFRWLESDSTPTASDFWVQNSVGGGVLVTRFSGFGNIVSGNYFDDAKAEIAVFDQYNTSEDPINPCFIAAFFIKTGGSDFALKKDVVDSCLPERQFMTPAIFDYNGSGTTDICVFVQPPAASNAPSASPNNLPTSAASHFNLWFSPGEAQYTPPDLTLYFDIDYPIPGDYDGDGIGDFAGSKNVGGSRLWRIRKSNATGTIETTFGTAADLPVPGDYDGDGKTDLAVYRPGEGVWYIKRSSDSQIITRTFGLPTDIPLALPNSNIYH